jgi:hypothetical protein
MQRMPLCLVSVSFVIATVNLLSVQNIRVIFLVTRIATILSVIMNNVIMPCGIMLNVMKLHFITPTVILLSVLDLNVFTKVMLNIIMQSVIMQSGLAPFFLCTSL